MTKFSKSRTHHATQRRPVFKYGLVVATLLGCSAAAMAAENISSVFGSYDGLWDSSSGAVANGRNDLLAFVVPGGTYSTGVNDAALTGSFTPAKFRAFRPDSAEIPLLGGQNAVPRSATYDPAKGRADYLFDGSNGLDLNTALFNIPQAELEFFAAVTNPNAITDTVPDVLVTQVGQPSTTTFDEFYFIDSNDQIVGNAVQVVFGGSAQVPSAGRQSWQFWNPNHTAQSNLNGDRDLRMRAYHLSDFGITAANMGQITKFVQKLSGASDLSFVAYNEDAVQVPALLSVKKDNGLTQLQAGKTNIIYTVTVSNAGGTLASDVAWTDTAQGLSVTGIQAITEASPGSGDDVGVCTVTGCIGISLAPGSSLIYEVSADVTGPAESMASNTARLDGGGCANGVATLVGAECSSTDEDLIVPPTASITVTKDNFSTEVLAGSTVLYTIVITNNGEEEVSGLSWLDSANGLGVISIEPLSQSAGSDAGLCSDTGCTDIRLPAAGNIHYGVLAQVTAATGALASNVVTVDGGDCTNGSSTNPNAICSAEDQDLVVAPALKITKAADFTAIKPGDTIQYTVSIENSGTGIATAVNWAEQPENMAILAISPVSASSGSSTGACAVEGCQNITIAKEGGSVVYNVTAQVAQDAVGDIVNTASLAGDSCTPDNCTSAVTSPVTAAPSAPTPVPVDSRTMLALMGLAVIAGFWRKRGFGNKPR